MYARAQHYQQVAPSVKVRRFKTNELNIKFIKTTVWLIEIIGQMAQ